ncbi:MAG: hypothetical protein JXB17_12335, partial [Bacteroidales bacterium]|nr:hypothetical protein [Bacteroidales bacterium]
QGIKFDPDVIDPEIINIAQKVFDQYAKIPSIEIWTEVSPVSLMRQIDFFWDSGMFADKKQALDICELIRQELVMIEKQAETGKKFQIDGSPATSENNFMFYWSEIEIGNNCIYVEIEDIKRVYLGYNTFNKLTTQNAYFSQEVENWIKNLIKKSNLLSKVSEKLRHQFFKKLSKNLEIIEARISSE